ncbi:response regulator [Nocardia terpenica]|uniref:Response regulator n=1 Tax=Nocardia terpenica TaxID=455432 RepID=A0A6G9Z727_9NOCA|nr:response regulator [Nocardia terpenica]QIS21157.1 response regulator [Nocardia terpenica]
MTPTMDYRILVASPLGKVVEPAFASLFPRATVAVAIGKEDVRRNILGNVRFDVVLTDLVWNRPELAVELSFDGLDVLGLMREADRVAPVILAAQGHSMEREHLEEARRHPEVAAVYRKSTGLDPLLAAIRSVAHGRREPPIATIGPRPLCESFEGRRGATAARLAGAIASGRAVDLTSLADAAGVGTHTASKVTNHYLGPIIRERAEHDPLQPMTLPAVARWCGLHMRYIVSWCRRHGNADVVYPYG